MIMIDIGFPSLGRTFDFSLEENTPIEALIDDIVGIVSKREHFSEAADTSSMVLCDVKKQRMLDPKRTLSECGIITGDKLLLV